MRHPYLCFGKDEINFIEQKVLDSQLFVTTLDHLGEEQYKIDTYFSNSNIDFYAILDRNVFTDIIKLADGEVHNNNSFRSIAVVMAFFQMSGIMLEPNLATYEFSDNEENLDKLLREIALFRQMDSLKTQVYIDFAMGKIDYIPLEKLPSVNIDDLPKTNVFKKPLKNFEFNFVILKKMAILKFQGMKEYEIMHKILDWSYHEFLFSGPAIAFINMYLSPNRLSKMVKSLDHTGLRNAAWDLTILHTWFQFIKKETTSNKRWILYTQDKAIKKIAKFLYAPSGCSEKEFQNKQRQMFIDLWGKNNKKGTELYDKYNNYLKNPRNFQREYFTNPKNSQVEEKINEEFSSLFQS